MKLLHNIKITVFEKDQNNENKVKEVLALLACPENNISKGKKEEEKEKTKKKNEEKEGKEKKITINKEIATGMESDKIMIFSVFLDRQKQISRMISSLKQHLGKNQVKKIKAQKLSRMDENLYFYIRLDKQALEKGKYLLTDAGNCYHIRLLLAAYPKNAKKGLEIADNLFSEERE